MIARNRSRHGMLMLETFAAVAVIAVVISASALAVSQFLGLRQRLYRTALAQQHLANVLEELDAWAFDDVNTDRIAHFQLPPAVVENLPSPRLVVKLDAAKTASPDEPVARRLDVTIFWNDRSGKPRASVSGSMWKFRGAE